MHLFSQWLFDHPVLSVAQGAFTLWMLIDCYRRAADYFWLWVILLLQPVGAWVYFFAVKVRDFASPQGTPGWLSWQWRPSLEELRYQAEQRPTLATHLALGERLIEDGEYAEALPHLEAAHAREPEHCQVLYALARCHRELGRPRDAIPLLEKIIARDRAWSDYKAWRLLVEVRDQSGDRPEALTACRELTRISPTLRHRCLLAEYLFKEGLTEEAHKLLEQSLEAHRFAPSPVRRLNRRWAAEARRLLKRGG